MKVALLLPGEALQPLPDDTNTGAKDGPLEAHILSCTIYCISWLQKGVKAHKEAGQVPHSFTDYLTCSKNAANLYFAVHVDSSVAGLPVLACHLNVNYIAFHFGRVQAWDYSKAA